MGIYKYKYFPDFMSASDLEPIILSKALKISSISGKVRQSALTEEKNFKFVSNPEQFLCRKGKHIAFS